MIPVLHLHPSPSSCSVPLQSWLHSARPEKGCLISTVKVSILSLFQVVRMGFNGYSICFNMFQSSKSWAETVVKSCFGVDNCAMNSEFNCLEYENANSEAVDIYGRYLWIHMDIYIFGWAGCVQRQSWSSLQKPGRLKIPGQELGSQALYSEIFEGR